MRKLLLWLGLAVLLAASAWGVDYVVERAAEGTAAPGSPGRDVSLELKYDSGTRSYSVAFVAGRDTWVGNDFDITMISGFRAIEKIKVYSTPSWPNSKWDGFNLAVYAFAGGRPTSLLWGPKYFKPARVSAGWCGCSVNWTLPSGNNAFVGAFEQFYNYPNCDPCAVDNNVTFLGHSWQYYGGTWRVFPNLYPYRNLMLRVIVNNTTVAVAPTSLGRVKALYF